MPKYRAVMQPLLLSLLLVALIGLPVVFSSTNVLAHWLPKSTSKSEQISLITPNEVRSLVAKAAASWVTGDAKAFAVLFTPDGEFIVPGQRLIGLAAIQHVATEFAHSHSQVSIKVRRVIVDGQQAVIEWRWEDVENQTGKRTQADDAIVVDFADGKIKRWREYIDTASPSTVH